MDAYERASRYVHPTGELGRPEPGTDRIVDELARCYRQIERLRVENEEQARLLGMSGEREADLRGEIEKLKKLLAIMSKAIADIAPWLSASLDDTECEEYREACNLIFAIDQRDCASEQE